jgi:hypothetical protein
MEAGTIPNDDSARILAAAGWQSDPRRLPVLRSILRDHLRRIYLYSYEESRNRAAAIDRTRRTLMRVARTMQSIPAGCPLVTWVFLALEEARVPPAVSSDFWRLLVIAEEERRAAAAHATRGGMGDGSDTSPAATEASTPVDGAAVSAAVRPVEATDEITPGATVGAPTSTASHPMLRPLVSLYARFLDVPESGDVEPRANWPAAEADLDCFLRAQFAETGDATCRPAPAWRRWLAARPWRRPQSMAVAAITVVVVAIAFVVGLTLVPPKGRRATFPGSARPPTTDTSRANLSSPGADSARAADNSGAAASRHALAPPSPEPTSPGRSADCQIASAQAPRGLLARGKASVRINGARCELITRDSLRFAWMPAQGVTEYRLCLITAKRDTLGIVPAISGTCVTVPVKGVPRMAVPGSFILRVDGLARGQLVAVSDPHPFEIP